MKLYSSLTFFALLCCTPFLSAQKSSEVIAPTATATTIKMVPYFEGCKYYQAVQAQDDCTTKKIQQHIYREMDIPQKYLNQIGEGFVLLSYSIQADGSLKDIRIDEDAGYDCGAKVLSALESLPPLVIPAEPGYESVDADSRTRCAVEINAKEGFYDYKKKREIEPTKDVFQIVEEMPSFRGCEEVARNDRSSCTNEKLKAFIEANLQYPEEAKANGTKGMTVVKFRIDELGFIHDPKLVRNIGDGCGEETIRLVNAMPRWNPGKQRGKEVSVFFNLPVRFQL